MQNIFLDNTTIEIHREIQTRNIHHVVFDFDGTISLVRDGWQNVMVPMMVECLQTETDTTETEAQLEALVVEFVDRLTGKQTIYQMMQLRRGDRKTRRNTARTPRLQRRIQSVDCCPLLRSELLDLLRGH